MWRDKYPAVPVREDVVSDHPAHVLACYTTRTDLVIIGRNSAPGSHPAIGGVQQALLNHARGPSRSSRPRTNTPADLPCSAVGTPDKLTVHCCQGGATGGA